MDKKKTFIVKCNDGEYIGLNFKPEKGVAYGIDQKTNMDKYIIHHNYDINGNRLDIIEIPNKKINSINSFTNMFPKYKNMKYIKSDRMFSGCVKNVIDRHNNEILSKKTPKKKSKKKSVKKTPKKKRTKKRTKRVVNGG
jgi:hypothetical protein